VKRTNTEQLPSIGTGSAHAESNANSPGFAPSSRIPVMVNGAEPLLETVRVFDGLVVPGC
jgi:hypothetical protein